MVSRVIVFVGALLALGGTWLFALVAAANACCRFSLQGNALLISSVFLFGLAGVVSWKLFLVKGYKPDA